MAEQETKVEGQEEVKPAVASAVKPAVKAKAKPPKASTKAKPKAKAKTAKKPKAKAKAKAAKKVKRPAKDDARKVAKASDGDLDTDQVRQLRALSKGKELTRDDLKEAVGIGRDGKYSQKWLDSLWALARKRPPLIAIGNYEGDRKSYHSITATGKAALKKAEDAAKKAAKAA